MSPIGSNPPSALHYVFTMSKTAPNKICLYTWR